MIIPKLLWTPNVVAQTPGDLSVTYTLQNGLFAQSGTIAVISLDVRFTPTYTTAANLLQITGCPLLPPGQWGGTLRFISNNITWPTGTTMVSPIINIVGGASVISFPTFGSGVASSNLPITAFPSGTPAIIQANFTAIVAS